LLCAGKGRLVRSSRKGTVATRGSSGTNRKKLGGEPRLFNWLLENGVAAVGCITSAVECKLAGKAAAEKGVELAISRDESKKVPASSRDLAKLVTKN